MDAKYLKLQEAIVDGEVDDGLEAADALVASGTDPVAIFTECVQDVLNDLGEQFGRLDIFLPELILASDVVKAVQDRLTPLMKKGQGSGSQGRAVIGTAYGDLHDIGKNMVSLMLQVNGFAVRDLGISVSTAQFIEGAKEHQADLILISGLMLPSLPYMKDTIDHVKGSDALRERFKIMVGGGPVTDQWAQRAGADGYSNDAMEAVTRAKELMATFHRQA